MAVSMFTSVRGSITRALDLFYADDQLAPTVTYKLYAGTTDVGDWVEEKYTEFSFQAIRTEHTVKSAKEAQGNVQAGETLYIIRSEDFPANASLKDVIVDLREQKKVKDISNVFDVIHMVTVEGSEID